MSINIFKKKKLVVAPSFFDYSSEEKKQIVKKAVDEANKMQKDLMKRYDSRIASQTS